MNLAWAAVGGATGLVAGALLRGPVFRLPVPAGAPALVACPGCDTRLRRWPSLRCWHCGRALGTPAVLGLVTAAVLALLAGRFGGSRSRWRWAFSVLSAWPWLRSASASSGCPTGSPCPPTRY